MENQNKIRTLLVSGDTINSTLQDWSIDEILSNDKPKHFYEERLVRDNWDNRTARCGMTYLEIEQIDYKYNY